MIKDLEDIAKQIADLYRDNLKNDGLFASGNLYQSVKGDIYFGGNYYSVILTLPDYWKYTEYGVNGAGPNGWKGSLGKGFTGKPIPVAPIYEWITVKKIVPYATNGKVPTTQQLAYMFSRSIPQNGIKPRYTLKNTLNSSEMDVLIEDFKNEIAEMYRATIIDIIKNTL